MSDKMPLDMTKATMFKAQENLEQSLNQFLENTWRMYPEGGFTVTLPKTKS